MLVRRELPDDVPQVTSVVARAFARDDGAVPVEVTLLEALRAGPDWLPRLAWVVADDAGRVLACAVCTRAWVEGAPVLALGPVAVRPRVQRRGAGSALVHALLGAADVLGAPLVGLLGDPAYYGRFGFRPSTEVGVLPPDPAWGAHFQVRTLTAHRLAGEGLRGTFRYAPPFSGR